MSDQSQTGMQHPEDFSSSFNVTSFLVRMLLNRLNTATLVQVKTAPYDSNGNTISNSNGNVPAVGFVDVQPLVNIMDGSGQATSHGTIYKVPYMRVQSGTNALIVDPQVNDIGIAVFADHDISSVKKNKARSNPGSWRRFDMADGIYIGGVLNPAPQMYVGFIGGGILATPDNGTTWLFLQPGKIQVTPDNGTTGFVIEPNLVTINKNVTIDQDGNFKTSGDVVAGTISLQNHTHAQGADSHGDSEQETNPPTG